MSTQRADPIDGAKGQPIFSALMMYQFGAAKQCSLHHMPIVRWWPPTGLKEADNPNA